MYLLYGCMHIGIEWRQTYLSALLTRLHPTSRPRERQAWQGGRASRRGGGMRGGSGGRGGGGGGGDEGDGGGGVLGRIGVGLGDVGELGRVDDRRAVEQRARIGRDGPGLRGRALVLCQGIQRELASWLLGRDAFDTSVPRAKRGKEGWVVV